MGNMMKMIDDFVQASRAQASAWYSFSKYWTEESGIVLFHCTLTVTRIVLVYNY
jgi:hypothetical protein